MRLQKRLWAWEPDDRRCTSQWCGKKTLGWASMAQEKAEPHISLPVHSLPQVPASLSVQPIDERMTSESLPQLEGFDASNQACSRGLLQSQPGHTDPTLTCPVNWGRPSPQVLQAPSSKSGACSHPDPSLLSELRGCKYQCRHSQVSGNSPSCFRHPTTQQPD